MGMTITTGTNITYLIGGNSMIFSYNEYYGNLYIFPIIIIILFSVVIFATLYTILYVDKLKIKFKVLIELVVIVLAITIIITNILQLNINIKTDEQNDIHISGVITSTETVKNPPKFHYNGDIVTPSIIIVNDIELYIMTIGNFEIGDEVNIIYLANSKVILEIHEVIE